VTLPDPLRAPTSLRFVWDVGRGRNHIVCLRTERVGGRYILDNYSSRNDGETSYHGRIHEDGRRESLENYEGQVSMPVLATPELTAREHERIWAWNEEVTRVLRSKGFL
jgi:hypothetical protein